MRQRFSEMRLSCARLKKRLKRVRQLRSLIIHDDVWSCGFCSFGSFCGHQPTPSIHSNCKLLSLGQPSDASPAAEAFCAICSRHVCVFRLLLWLLGFLHICSMCLWSPWRPEKLESQLESSESEAFMQHSRLEGGPPAPPPPMKTPI